MEGFSIFVSKCYPVYFTSLLPIIIMKLEKKINILGTKILKFHSITERSLNTSRISKN